MSEEVLNHLTIQGESCVMTWHADEDDLHMGFRGEVEDIEDTTDKLVFVQFNLEDAIHIKGIIELFISMQTDLEIERL
jgi:hypothetical protein